MTVSESISYLKDVFPFTIRGNITRLENGAALIIGYECRAGGGINLALAAKAIENLVETEGLALKFTHVKDNDFTIIFKEYADESK